MKFPRWRVVTLGWCVWLAVAFANAAEPRGHQASLSVAQPTRMDFVFPLANQSPATLPDDWLPADYDSTAQRYEAYIPPDYKPKAKQAYPLVLFISPGDDPAGWAACQPACEKQKMFFASPFGAGNNCEIRRRVRIVLDVLDDLRQRYRIDPERTYIGGFSGGGRIALSIATALPEYFGGAVPVCAAGDLRNESWLQHRAIDRLSIALLTGENDFNRGEVERFRGPYLSEIGVRAKVWNVAGLGHGIPDGATMSDALAWLEEGVRDRRKLAKTWPATSVPVTDAPSRTESAAALLTEAKKRLDKPATLYRGLMQLQGLSARWADLPAGKEAKRLLVEYDQRDERPWEEEDIAEQRKFLIARARSLDAYGSGPLPQQYEGQRADMLRGAIQFWEQVVQDRPDSPAGQEGAKRLPELKTLLEKTGAGK